ncbi:MAG: tRNA pseudouridine(38-40) synthase TruA [Acidobacteria bacterium]|nr:MAG: tRNA pseudouridine(38-40) synthase TruA [Acidobacteriota bacterium]
MATWKLTLEYDGTRYYGWQEQKNARTIAGELRLAAEDFFSKPVEIAGAGRTDAGVHALGQVARLRTDWRQKRLDLLHALNDRLPPDINVLKVEEARGGFDPRREALARHYLYQISSRRTAFAKRFVWWVKDKLDEAAMREAAGSLIGRHDFARFRDKRAEEGSTIVVVNDIQLASDGDLLLFRIGASHFLWKMVRRVVGALVEVGRGSISAADFASLIDGRRGLGKASEFDAASHTAPPSGLFLERVVYGVAEHPGELIPVFPVAHW